MNIYSTFDYLCNEPFDIPEVGSIICPTLRDIRHITYKIFSLYVNMLSMPLPLYRKALGLESQFEALSEDEKKEYTFYYLLLYTNPQLLWGMLSFFLKGTVVYDDSRRTFTVLEHTTGEEKEEAAGSQIGNDNFELFRTEVLKILGIGQTKNSDKKYKNEKARQLMQKITKAKEALAEGAKQDTELALDNMVKKYCTHNKTGINILNVWDMTFRQFQEMFQEYQYGRQADYHDSIAANTFSYKEASDYKPMLWLEQIH